MSWCVNGRNKREGQGGPRAIKNRSGVGQSGIKLKQQPHA
ncbi:tomoregulin-2 [Acetobacter orientalis]|uniref:Tomoregulin-2 n=1 Tax=Acetobacter orientalis TaxID=146474 RepID=A0A2Z5ZFK8_9PROT|nr:tomoregulin-2 [Acetobacter orientalis]